MRRDDHWALQYVGRPFREHRDCYGWFRFWRRVHFDDTMPAAPLDPNHLTQSAARIMVDQVEALFGWVPTDTPAEGDAVFLAMRTRPHHVGMYILADGQPYVIHAIEGVGVVASTPKDLVVNGWRITGYYTRQEPT